MIKRTAALRKALRSLLGGSGTTGNRRRRGAKKLRVESLEDRRLMTAVPQFIDTDYTVQQINEGGEPLYNKPAIYGTSMYYLDSDTTHGAELRRLNTSTGAVSFVADINPGVSDSYAGRTGLVVANNKLYFTAIDPTHGMELRWMDLTQSNPSIQVLDLVPGEHSSSPGALGGLAAIGNKLYFLAGNLSDPQLYWIDTTSSSPMPNVANIDISDMRDFADAYNVVGFTAVGNKLYFAAPDAASGYELRYIDTATAPSTVHTIDQTTGADGTWTSHTFRGMFSVANKLYFRIVEPSPSFKWLDTALESPTVNTYADLSTYDFQIVDGNRIYFIKSNDSETGGIIRWLDASQSNPAHNLIRFTSEGVLHGPSARTVAVVGSKLYFVATQDSQQRGSLYWVDLSGSTAQANRIPLNNGSGSTIDSLDGSSRFDYHFQVVGNKLYFVGDDQTLGQELSWIDTTQSNPTVHTIDINTTNNTANVPSGSQPGRFGGFTVVGNKMFFTARTYDQPTSLSDPQGSAESQTVAFGQRYPAGDTDLYWIDTTQDDPALNRIELFSGAQGSIDDGSGGSLGLNANAIVGTKLFFHAQDPYLGVRTRWIDTSIPNGPVHTLDNIPYGDPVDVLVNFGRQGNFGVVGTKVFFGSVDHRLRWVDTNESGMPLHQLNEDIQYPGEIGGYAVAGTRLYFFASVNSVWKLAWIDTSLAAPTVNILDGFGSTPIHNATHRFLQVVGDRLYFSGSDAAGEGLKWIDLTAQSPVVRSIDGSAQFTNPTLVGNRLYMIDKADDSKLYWVDAAASSPQLASIAAKRAGVNMGFKSVGSKLYFDAFDSTSQTQRLYWIDSAAATPALNSVSGNFDLSLFSSKMVTIGEMLFFAAADAGSTVSSRTIRWIDTTENVARVLDTGLSVGTTVYATIGNRLYFIASDAQHGREVCWFDINDLDGAVNIVDISYGSDDTIMSQSYAVVNNKLYFTAHKVGLGAELIALNTTDENGAITAVGESYDVPVNYMRRTDDALGALTTLGQDNGVLANDTGLGSNATATLITPPAHGTLTFNPDGTFRYKPAANAVVGQIETFTYRATDSSGQTSDATVELKISASITSPFHNQTTPTDVDSGSNPGATTPLDALAIINLMNSKQLNAVPVEDVSTVLGYHYDVNNDFVVSALDLLAVFNFLNAQSLAQGGEGERYAIDDSSLSELHDATLVDLTDLPNKKRAN